MAPPLRKGSGLVRQRLTGLAFLSAIIGLVLLTVAMYQKKFTPVVMVDLQADRIGNQLTPHTDVKIRGLLVGEVRSVESKGNGATIALALQKDKVKLIPRNVQAQMLPKTLFGEKFVALQLPPQPSGTTLREGDVIAQDRSRTSLETEKVLDDSLPLLQALEPEQLSFTLNALSGALRGRGDKIGDSLVRTDAYLKAFNPQLPTLRKDFVGIADLADTYDEAMPDILTVLDNVAFSSRSLMEQREELAQLLKTTSGFSDTTRGFLAENRNRFVRLAVDSTPSLQLYAKYAPEYPCLAQSLTEAEPIVEDTFGGLQPGLHITLEVTRDNGGFEPGEEPEYRDTKGPSCFGLGDKKVIPFPDYFNPNDGYQDGVAVDPQTGRAVGDPGPQPTDGTPLAMFSAQSSSFNVQDSNAGAVRAALAPVMGTPIDEVPDVATLLFAPMAGGTTIHVA